MAIVIDKLDQEIKVGDWIANPWKSNQIHFGKVTEITKSKGILYKVTSKGYEHTTRRRREKVLSLEPSSTPKYEEILLPQFIKITPTKQMEIDYEKL